MGDKVNRGLCFFLYEVCHRLAGLPSVPSPMRSRLVNNAVMIFNGNSTQGLLNPGL